MKNKLIYYYKIISILKYKKTENFLKIGLNELKFYIYFLVVTQV